MAAGIRKAALSCVGKLTVVWCMCVNADDEESRGN